eukprot:scaffold13.g303.t1
MVSQAPPPPSPELERLIRESEEAIKRLETLEKGGKGLPLGARVSAHLRRHGSTLVNIGLAASVLAVAMGRLGQKYEFQSRSAQAHAGAAATRRELPRPLAARDEWEEQRQRLLAESAALRQRADALEASTAALVGSIESAVEKGGRGLASSLHTLLAEHKQQHQRQRQAEPGAGSAGAGVASAPAAGEQQQAAAAGAQPDTKSRLMI